ncbi:MAG: histidine kinase N-terminal 7TM domain-containing protein [Eubacteriales bacterium]|nr:histidine kinase N-terminal 7TM domain-containing protein [Eubacteriales bacterium]MDD3504586.1 histidine kinase N-terminal 7TM domain-containing protein [Eubacteriales bacterium]MDD4683524.1 histidine kinase N-terminal 7TM domain-containing protein [Eubacteriales bacterium]
MEISEKLMHDIAVITGSHMIALIIIVGLTGYIWFKASRSVLLYSYSALVGMIIIWLAAKIFKTISPNIGLRWFFIVLQYFGVQFLGFFLIIFAIIFTRGTVPARKHLISLGIFPAISFFIVLTNPIHMRFYSYFDFYRDRFGSLFLPIQAGLYVYLTIGVIILSRGYFRQPVWTAHPRIGLLMAIVTLLPLTINVYYLMFKFDLVDWFFTFPVFDITPLCITAAIILFIIPAIRYRFLDILPLSYNAVIENIPDGVALCDSQGRVVIRNKEFNRLLDLQEKSDYIKHIEHDQANGFKLVQLHDMTEIEKMRQVLSAKNTKLKRNLNKLQQMNQQIEELALIQAKRELAQGMHDMLGHNLTVAIGQCELLSREENLISRKEMLDQLRTMVETLPKAISEKTLESAYLNNLTDSNNNHLDKLKAKLTEFENDLLNIEIEIQGRTEKLDEKLCDAIIGLVRETSTNAIKHGKANKLNVFLRSSHKQLDIITIDDGCGCRQITKNMGLSGIENRIRQLDGHVTFRSSEEGGFYTYATIPLS